jgi:hypothetical protein
LDETHPSVAIEADDPSLSATDHYFERQVARLLIVLYYCGQPVASLIDGETRQVDSLSRLQQFDFWVREPGHLALALLDAYATTPDAFADRKQTLRDTLNRSLKDNQADTRRVMLPGAPYHIFEDFDRPLSFLTSRALVSDRPSFARSRSQAHRIILEAAGVKLVQQILNTCPSYEWYRLQCETVAAFFTALEKYDLRVMTYLAPDLTPAMVASSALIPHIQRRFGANRYADL